MDVKPIAISLLEVTARYGRSERPVLDNVSFTVQRGSVCTILGANGVGKSTLLRCLTGLITLDTGQILIDGDPVASLSHGERARRMALVSQSEQSAFALSVLEIVTTGRAAHLGLFARPGRKDMDIAFEALEKMRIAHLASQSFAELSGGQRQMVRIARALAQQCPTLVLDEPTAHLDLANQMQVLGAISRLMEQNHTVIMTSHDPEHAFFCGGSDLLLRKGRPFLSGPVDHVIDAQSLSDAYGVPISLTRSGAGDVNIATNYSQWRQIEENAHR